MAKKNGKKTISKEVAKKEAAKAAKFVELGEARTVKAINAVRSIGKLSNKNNYGYTPEQAEIICATLDKEIANLRELFAHTKKAKGVGFTLS